MKRMKRPAAILIMVAGTIGLLFSAAAIGGLWYVKASLTRLGTGMVGPLASVITVGQEAVADVADGMTTAALELDRCHQKSVQFTGTADRKKAAAALLQEMIAAGLAEKARSAGEALRNAQQLQQAMVSVNQALRQILPAGAMPPLADGGMLAGITPLLGRLQSVLKELDTMAMEMTEGRMPLDGDLLAGRIGTAQEMIQRVGIQVKEAQARVALGMADLMELKAKMSWYINMGCIALSVILLWLAFVHGCVLFWGACVLAGVRSFSAAAP